MRSALLPRETGGNALFGDETVCKVEDERSRTSRNGAPAARRRAGERRGRSDKDERTPRKSERKKERERGWE